MKLEAAMSHHGPVDLTIPRRNDNVERILLACAKYKPAVRSLYQATFAINRVESSEIYR